jgi:hypothetical protein
MSDEIRTDVDITGGGGRISRRLISCYLNDKDGQRPVFGSAGKFQTDTYFHDHLLFYEYFHGDDSSGLGASHQTGWTGLLANLLYEHGSQRKRSAGVK